MKNTLFLLSVSICFWSFANECLMDSFTLSLTTTPAYCTADGKIHSVATGGTEPYHYRLEDLNGTTLRSPQNSPDFEALAVGQYRVVVTDANGNTASEITAITSNYVLPTLVAVRNGANIQLTVLGGRTPFRFSYSKNGVASRDTSTNGIYPCLDYGDYVFQVFDQCNNFYSYPLSIRSADYFLNLDSCSTNADGS